MPWCKTNKHFGPSIFETVLVVQLSKMMCLKEKNQYRCVEFHFVTKNLHSDKLEIGDVHQMLASKILFSSTPHYP